MASLTATLPHGGRDNRPLVVHVMHRFDTGGLENGVVNLINGMDPAAYRHAVLALTEVTAFRRRVTREDVEFFAMNKPPGQGFWLYPRLFRLFRQLRPAIVHTRNLGAMEVVVPAWAAGVPVRIHGEHGREMNDLDGSNRRHQWMRRAYKPFVTHFFALSRDLADYLSSRIGVAASRLSLACNGVDTERFRPADGAAPAIPGCPFDSARHWLVGTVGRMQTVKNQVDLARAFVQALHRDPALKSRLRLVLVGDGPQREPCQAILRQAGVEDLAWLPGERSDVPEVLRGLHLFVLPSLAEGISNTILEAMASGLPVLATDVGGNAELVVQEQTGLIVPPGSVEALSAAMARLAADPQAAHRMGMAARERARREFSLQSMIDRYRVRYDAELGLSRPALMAQTH